MDCDTGGRWVRMDVIDPQVAELVKRLQLPDDWRERLEVLAGRVSSAAAVVLNIGYFGSETVRDPRI